METTLYNISQVLGITIIHSLWQGMLVYFVLRIIFAGFPSIPSVKKYQLAIFALVSLAALFIYTLLAEVYTYNWAALKPVPLSTLLPSFSIRGGSHFKPSYYDRFAAYMPYICALYFAGLLANILKLGWEWNKIQKIKQSLISAEQMQQFINSFSKKFGIARQIKLNFSALVDVPCVIGYVKPLILLPVSLSVHLSACEVESILLHELSHIKRNDYLVNLLQQVISAALFFNPFSWLINRIVNQERENSCDDLVVEKTGKPLIYAKALLKLETARTHDLQLALAITGKKFYLLRRIERIMKTQKQIGNMRHLFIAILLFAGGLCSIAWFNPANAKISTVKASTPKSAVQVIADSTAYLPVIDTAKHKTQGKVIAKNAPGTKKHYVAAKQPVKTKPAHAKQGAGFDGTFSDSLSNFYQSAEWKNQVEALHKQSEELRKKFDSPEWKNQMDAMRGQGEEMRKKFDSPEWKSQVLAMQRQGNELRKKFESPEWKKQMDDIKKQGDEMKKKFESPEWKKQLEDMKRQGDEMKKQFDNPEWKKQMDDMKKQGDEMKKKFESPEWKKQVDDMKRQADMMKKQFDNPEWKKQMEDMKKQGEEMKKQYDSPEWKKQMRDIKKQADEIKKQFDNPEWKKEMKDQKWRLRDSVGGTHLYTPAEKDTVKQ